MSPCKVVLTNLCLVCCLGTAMADAIEAESCADFRCEFGDVPKAAPPLLPEPFRSFYEDQTVRPMLPYQEWGKPSRWKTRATRPSSPAAREEIAKREEAPQA